MRVFVALVFLFVLSGCGTEATNIPLGTGEANVDRRTLDVEPDRPFIALTFSGGGSRAAVLAAAVTARLNGITYPTTSGAHALSEDIKVVSSVSGGSVFAAYLGLHDSNETTIQDFQKKMADFDGMAYLKARAFNPFSWLELAEKNQTRVAFEQEMIGDLLGQEATLSAFNQPDKPLILLNASDMVAGEVFTFDPQALGDLCMNYDNVPVSLAVTASAAVPGAFTPILLKNGSYPDQESESPKCLHKPENWLNALKDPAGRYTNLEAFRRARYRNSLRAGKNAYRQPHYVRLLDGGVIDNLGLTTLRRSLTMDSPAKLGPFIQKNQLKKLVVIVVNARRDEDSELNHSPKYTGLLTQAASVADVLVDSASAGSAGTFRGFVSNLKADINAQVKEGYKEDAVDIYPIEIDFDQLPDQTPEDREKLNKVKAIPTSWTLKHEDAALLDEVAGQLLWRHPCFRRLLKDLNASGNEEAPAVPGTKCF